MLIKQGSEIVHTFLQTENELTIKATSMFIIVLYIYLPHQKSYLYIIFSFRPQPSDWLDRFYFIHT